LIPIGTSTQKNKAILNPSTKTAAILAALVEPYPYY
jgi:hypothetical protein